ncbi:helix-turn-helix domain-containing protein [Mangrovitalea sediminis]|uniref:hypothetical protein n=1 Tax=Mangrovitalea sediminis TaxID=1982043 RepID=UPI000BE53F67|nr:hypothetical protein [Mangrovitalea sediminis]
MKTPQTTGSGQHQGPPAADTLNGQRARFLQALQQLDEAWVIAFHETGLSDVYFSRLFTELWERGDKAVSKTDAYSLVKGVSPQTAMKYVHKAIKDGHLEEIDNPDDRRSRLLRMSPALQQRFEEVIDRARSAFIEVLAKE